MFWVIKLYVSYGPVAQLGERAVRIRKVEGSSPFRSTKNIEKKVLNVFIQATGLVYHHDTVVYIIKGGYRPCISSRFSVYFSCSLMRYNTLC